MKKNIKSVTVTIDDLWEFGDELTAESMEDEGSTTITIFENECTPNYWKELNKFLQNKENK